MNELEVMAQLNAVLDDLTRMGPSVTVRVMVWALDRYGIEPASFPCVWRVRDRRVPKTEPVIETPIIEPPTPPQPPVSCPICGKEFSDRRGVGGHAWKKHHIRMTEYKPTQEQGA